ncbi:M24 family metallopeptidase [Enterococcus alishanensis]|uniref:M24 family metallopeptidase n=1 Tax=Enterococcus alishanensis TaxID=1303817 RepID=UPI0031B7FD0F
MKIKLVELAEPILSNNVIPVDLTQNTMDNRKNNLLKKMMEKDLDTVLIYADREHGSNFEYFTGFIPRFEEALLVVHVNGDSFLLLGNENTKMVEYSRINAHLIHVPYFSLPNQPMEHDAKFISFLKNAQIKEDTKVAVIGWKNFTSKCEKNEYLFDIPYYIIDNIKKLVNNDQKITNGSDLLISPRSGLRIYNNSNEIAHYEYGATLSGIGILNTLNHINVGKTELEIANYLTLFGQPNNVTTICSTGDRFSNATLYPRNKELALGDKFSASVGYKGGLSSRAAYVASSKDELSDPEKNYEAILAKPYYSALVTWLESIHVGCKAGEIFRKIEEVLPQKKYHWELNPGHFVADEEWMSSPFYDKSPIEIKSGQLFQIDIIPKID